MPDPQHAASAAMTWGAAVRALPGEPTSGDQYLVHEVDGNVLVAVVDGVGHGAEATRAAERALAAVRAYADLPPLRLAERCHEIMRGTRGAVMTLAKIHPAENTLTWIAVGNVAGVVHRANPAAEPRIEAVIQRGGILGYTLPAMIAATVQIAPDDVIVFATDGILPTFVDVIESHQRPQLLADRLIASHARAGDDALALVIRYRGRE